MEVRKSMALWEGILMSDIIFCAFCGHTLEEARRMAGPGGGDPNVYICHDCATLIDEQMRGRKGTDSGKAGTEGDFRCSFCGQIRNASCLAAHVHESGVRICGKCVELRRCMMENDAASHKE